MQTDSNAKAVGNRQIKPTYTPLRKVDIIPIEEEVLIDGEEQRRKVGGVTARNA